MAKEKTKITKSITYNLLEWTYSKAIGGFAGADSAYEIANSYLDQTKSLEQQVDSLIRWQVAKASTSGFVTGLGGVLTMPITVPANVASILYIQTRMIVAIAHMGGHDINSDKVKALIFISMTGNGAKEMLKGVSVKSGNILVSNILQQVSVRLASKIGEKTATSLSKAIPLVGGVIGGGLDATSTLIIGKIAKRIFINKDDIMYQLITETEDQIE